MSRKGKRPPDEPRGRIVFSTKKYTTDKGTAIGGRKSLIVAYVHTVDVNTFKDYVYRNSHLLQSKLVQQKRTGADRWNAYEVIGLDSALASLCDKDFLLDWHFALSVTPPRGGQGNGPVKPRKPGLTRWQTIPVPGTEEQFRKDKQEQRETHVAHTEHTAREGTAYYHDTELVRYIAWQRLHKPLSRFY